MEHINLLDCDGMPYCAMIDGMCVEGIISVENGTVFLCQNRKNGNSARDKKGFLYSWNVYDGSPEHLESNQVIDFKLLESNSPELKNMKKLRLWSVGNIVKKGEKTATIIDSFEGFVQLQFKDDTKSMFTRIEKLEEEGWSL